jgi:hypothetical protein
MINVGEVYIGEEIFTVRRVESEQNEQNEEKSNKFNKNSSSKKSSSVYYGCSSGTIGKIKSIS